MEPVYPPPATAHGEAGSAPLPVGEGQGIVSLADPTVPLASQRDAPTDRDPTRLDLAMPARMADATQPAEPALGLPAEDPSPRRRGGARDRWIMLALCAPALLAGIGTAAAALYLRAQTKLAPPGLRLGGQPLSGGGLPWAELPAQIHLGAERLLAQPVLLRSGDERARATLRELGVSVDEAQVLSDARAVLQSGDAVQDLRTLWRLRRDGQELPVPLRIDRERALDFLTELKDRVDRAPSDARLDLERHSVAAERPGYLLRVYESLVALEYAARAVATGTSLAGLGEIPLSVATTEPHVRAADLKDIDVSSVLATWETRYSSAAIDNDRTYNLKVGADKLNGHIIKPGASFSFNEVVGDRTEKQGYRVAPVIQGGELIDGLAGGMCQIASTLHAAAFFGGLEIVRSTPHSRPSAYIPMGLDSTVVWPYVDLKLRNPFDFPVVLHYMVNQGSVKVELLGKARPYKVAYEREILSESAFGVQTRPDPTMPLGQKLIDQEGYPGYHIKRRRYLYTGAWKLDPRNDNRPKPEGLVAVKEWELGYPATAQIVRVGTGPATLKKREPSPAHRIPPVSPHDKPFFYVVK